MEERKVLVGSVLATTFVQRELATSNELPFVYVMHGRLGTQEDVFDICRKLASFGFVGVTFDNPNHGSRFVREHASENGAWNVGNLTHAVDMYSQIIDAANTISLLIDFLPVKLNVKGTKHAVCGISQGGHATLMALTHELRLCCGVAFIAAGDYLTNMKVRYETLKSSFENNKIELKVLPSWQSLMPEGLIEVIDKYDPINNAKKFCTKLRPVLMLNGENDTIVPTECNRNFVDAIKKYYDKEGESELLQFTILPRVKHEVPNDMLELGLEFLKEHLLDKNGVRLNKL